MSYSETSAHLALNSSIAVMVFGNAEGTDLEMLMLRPRQADSSELAELADRWPGRGLRSLGVMGLCEASPRFVFKEPLKPEVISRLADAFLAYLHALFCDSLDAQRRETEIRELRRLWSLNDPRMA
jgi:hypothetical protein